jgi:hypothetical protein
VAVNCAKAAPRHENYDGRKQQDCVLVMQIQCQEDEQYYEGGDVQKAFPDKSVFFFQRVIFNGSVITADFRHLGIAIGEDFPAIDAFIISEAVLGAAFCAENIFVVLYFRTHDSSFFHLYFS